jgi:hypothetical protein
VIASGNGSGDLTDAGELWVDYEVELITPQMAEPSGPGRTFLIYGSDTGFTLSQPFGDDPDYSGSANSDDWTFSTAYTYARLTLTKSVWRPYLVIVFDTTTTATHGYSNATISGAVVVSMNGGSALTFQPGTYPEILGAGATCTHGVMIIDLYSELGRPWGEGDYMSFAVTNPPVGSAKPIVVQIFDLPVFPGLTNRARRGRQNWIAQKERFSKNLVKCYTRQEMAKCQKALPTIYREFGCDEKFDDKSKICGGG